MKKRKARVVVVGSANVDLTTFTDRFPRPGETLFGERFDLGFGGKGANQAVAAALSGAKVEMVARLGDDLFGPATLDNFKRLGVGRRQVRIVKNTSSGVAPIFVDPTGQNRILVVKGANDALDRKAVRKAKSLLGRSEFLVLQLEIPIDTVYYAIRFAKERGVRVILNPAPASALEIDQIREVDYLIPNETEAEAITGKPFTTLADATECARDLVGKGFQRVILTLGERGSLLASADTVEHLPGYPVKTVDSTGAGDAFIGSFAAFLGEGFSERGAVARANLYAALSTTAVGTQKSFVTRSKFDREWKKRGGLPELVTK
jgi:ribokinase